MNTLNRIIDSSVGIDRHRLPTATVHPADGQNSSEIRFPVYAGTHNTRARREGGV